MCLTIIRKRMLAILFAIMLLVSTITIACSVTRDHPKTVPAPSSSGSYSILIKIKNEISLIESVRTTCAIVQVYNGWQLEKESTGNVLIRVKYKNMSAGDCHRLLTLLDDIYGVTVLEAITVN